MSIFQQKAEKRKQEIADRLEYHPESSKTPVFDPGTLHYEISDRIKATSTGGIGMIHQLVRFLGIPEQIDSRLHLLKQHLPYHESDHLLNLIYNFVCGGDCLDDIELLRNNPAYLEALGTRRIPDPTTAGDFLRRMGYDDNLELMNILNDINNLAWKLIETAKDNAILDIDSKVEETYGECKEGLDMSYKGQWGFHPLVVTESTTSTHVGFAFRSGNAASAGSDADWLIDYSIDRVTPLFNRVFLRGDSAFSLTYKFDSLDKRNVGFCFGYKSTAGLTAHADSLQQSSWKRFHKQQKPKSESYRPRKRKTRVKEKKVRERGYRYITTEREFVAEFPYQPNKCGQVYRMIVLRKEIRVEKGQLRFENEFRDFFYITNIQDMSPAEVVEFIRDRCNHENLLQQLSGGVHALKTPTCEFNANRAFMLLGAFSWNLKSWLAFNIQDAEKRNILRRMKYKKFVREIIYLPAQILRTGRRTVIRLLHVNDWTVELHKTFLALKQSPCPG